MRENRKGFRVYSFEGKSHRILRVLAIAPATAAEVRAQVDFLRRDVNGCLAALVDDAFAELAGAAYSITARGREFLEDLDLGGLAITVYPAAPSVRFFGAAA